MDQQRQNERNNANQTEQADQNNANQEQTSEEKVQEIKDLKSKIYGYLKRSKPVPNLVGITIIELDRAFHNLKKEEISQQHFDKLHSQVDTAVKKGMEVVMKKHEKMRTIQDLLTHEDQWREERKVKQWRDLLSRGQKTQENPQERPTSDSEEEGVQQGEQTVFKTPEENTQNSNDETTRPGNKKKSNNKLPIKRKESIASTESTKSDDSSDSDDFWDFVRQQYKRSNKGKKKRSSKRSSRRESMTSNATSKHESDRPNERSETEGETTKERTNGFGKGKTKGRRDFKDRQSKENPQQSKKMGPGPQNRTNRFNNSYNQSQPFQNRTKQNDYNNNYPQGGAQGPPSFNPYWGGGYFPPPWRMPFPAPDLAFGIPNRQQERNDYTRRLQDDQRAQQRMKYPSNWKVPNPSEILPEHRHFYDTERVISKGLIKPFMGTIEDYPRFQQSFYNMVHIQPGPVFDKIMALDRLITDDQTVKLLSGLGTTAADYVSRIERLEQTYGGPNRLKNYHLRVLRNLEGLVDDSLENLRTYAHSLDNYLKNSADTESDNLVLLQVIKGRMSRALKVEYNAYLKQERITDDNESMSLFLRNKLTNEIEARDEDAFAKKSKKEKKGKDKDDSKEKKTNQLHQMKRIMPSSEDESEEQENVIYAATKPTERKPAAKTGTRACYGCEEEGHTIHNCEKFYIMMPNDRRQFVTDRNLCYLCLSPTHRIKDCPKKEYRRCGICKGRHHFLLHPAPIAVSKTVTHQEPHDQVYETSDSEASFVCCAYQQARRPSPSQEWKPLEVAITFITVYLRNPRTGKEVKTNLLLDTGANNCSIDTQLAKELGLHGPKEPYHVQVGGGRINSYSSFSAEIKVRGVHENADEYDVTFQTYKQPCGRLENINWNERKKVWPHLQDLPLPESADRPVEGIIGMAEPWLLAPLQAAVTGGRHDPIALKTRLGWTVGGRVMPDKVSKTQVNVTFVHQNESYEQTREDLQRFWMPSEGATGADIRRFNEGRTTMYENKAVQEFERTVKRLPEGQYQVGLLWKNDAPLPYNYREALRMYHHLEQQMDKNTEMRTNFNHTLNEWINKRIVQYVASPSDIKYFLPTFMVVRAEKATTAYRLVVDGARKFSGVCINDRLLPGPSMIHKVFDVMCKMRVGRYAFTCDVQAMYLNVKVAPEDRKYLGMFFREHSSGALKIVQFTSHPFGLTSSPYVAMRTVSKHAQQNQDLYPLAAQAVLESVIVDDFIVAGDSQEVLTTTLQQLESLLIDIGMGVHKVAASHESIVRGVDESRIAKTLEIGGETAICQESALPTVKTLGLIWNARTDTLQITFSPKHEQGILTLRKIASDGGRLYDPLGIVLPVTMAGRILQQACWSFGTGWDEKLDEDLQSRWKKWVQKTKRINEIKVPRSISQIHQTYQRRRLITFVDASSEAHAAVVYMQTLYSNGQLGARLMAAKGKVTSLNKPESIPRLECAAAALGAEFTAHICSILYMERKDVVYFSDSSTTLWWIKANKPLKTYVANRVCLVLDHSEARQWKHIDTHDNPADLPTRTMSARRLKRSELWHFGPSFLARPEQEWPTQRVLHETSEARGEERAWDTILDKVTVTKTTQSYDELGQFLRTIWGRWSASSTGLNVASYVYQAIWFWENKKEQEKLENKARIDLAALRRRCIAIMIKQEQEVYLHDLKTDLRKHKEIHRRFAGWRPYLDEQNIIHITGRTGLRNDPNVPNQPPMMLTKDMPLATELMKLHHEHYLQHVGGVRYLLNHVRKWYWIEAGLTVAKRVIRNCSHCQRTKMHELPYQIAPMHDSKWKAVRPFSHLGVDMFGPIEVKMGRGKTRAKRYGIIFTCQFTRAINVEMVMDATGYSCYLAFKRHASIYGQPMEINSDRGSNFQQVRTSLHQATVQWEDAQPIVQEHYPEIKWTMNPPRTPSFGGHFESLVKVIKNTFKTLVKWPNYNLTDEELMTSFKEAAGLANMRPLTELSDDPQDQPPLTPSQFLVAPILNMNPEWDVPRVARNLESETSRVKRLLWTRMRDELSRNLQRARTINEADPLVVGEVVIVRNQEWRADRWPLALVIELFPGKDGRVRVVKVRTLKTYDKKDSVHETTQSTKNILRIKWPPATQQGRLLGSKGGLSNEENENDCKDDEENAVKTPAKGKTSEDESL